MNFGAFFRLIDVIERQTEIVVNYNSTFYKRKKESDS
jgi:hypothetical protein